MALPEQTFNTISQLKAYINQFIIPNGQNEITGTEHNNVENALANFIVTYTLNSGLVNIITGGGPVTLPAPITAISTTLPSSLRWNDNVQNEYYIINLLGAAIPLAAGLTYTDLFGIAQTTIPLHAAIHIAKTMSGTWIQVNNDSGGGTLQADPHTLLGRYASTAGPIQEITIGAGLALDSVTGVLSATITVAARNGLSVDSSGDVVFGQDVADINNPAMLLSAREIPFNGFGILFTSDDGSFTTLAKNQFKMTDASGNVSITSNVPATSFTIMDSLGVATFSRSGLANMLISNTRTDIFPTSGTIALLSDAQAVNTRTNFLFTDDSNTITNSPAIFQIQNQTTIANSTETANILEILATFNTSGTPTGIALLVTNTASGAGSKLIDLQVGGTSKFSVFTNSGNVVAGGADDGNFFQIHQPSITNSANALNITSTWNTAGTPTLIKGAVINTASGNGSKLIELIGGGTTQLSIDVSGAPILIGPTLTDNLHDVQISGFTLFDNSIDVTGASSVTIANGSIIAASAIFGGIANVVAITANSIINGGTFEIVDLNATWNAGSAVQNGIRLRVTDTASGAASLLFDVEVGGTSQFNVRKDGLLTLSATQLAAAVLNTVDHKIMINIAGTTYYLLASTSPT